MGQAFVVTCLVHLDSNSPLRHLEGEVAVEVRQHHRQEDHAVATVE